VASRDPVTGTFPSPAGARNPQRARQNAGTTVDEVVTTAAGVRGADRQRPQRSDVARWRRLAWTFIPPCLALIAGRILVLWGTDASFFSLEPALWARYDSGHYYNIARDGYHFGDCAALEMGEPGVLCQNTTWYPLLPWLMRLGGVVGIDYMRAAILISLVAWSATVFLLWTWFLRALPPHRSIPGLLLVAVFPGVVYQQAAFPLSLLALGMVVWTHLMATRRWMLGAVAATVAGTAYPIGLMLVPTTLVWVGYAERASGTSLMVALRRAVPPALVASAGTLLVFAIHQIEVQHWDASLTAQRSGGSTVLNPVQSLWLVVVERGAAIQQYPNNASLARWTAWQTAVVAVLVLATAASVGVAFLRRRVDHVDVGMTLGLLAVWLLPLATFLDTGLYRREATLVAFSGLVARRLPVPVLLVTSAAALVLVVGISPLFFDYVLI